MLTQKDYCDYDTCVALWSMGLIPHPYDNTDTDKVMAIISLYEAQKWLREEKQMVVLPAYLEVSNVWICEICYKRERLGFGEFNQLYEEALLEGIKEAVKILKDEQTK